MATILKKLRSIAAGKFINPISCDGCKMAIVVRTDIGMGKGKIAAQCAHAAIECYRQALASSRYQALLKTWEFTGQPKIVLRISSQSELTQLAQTAESHGVITATIRDAGRTQLAPGTVSVLGIGPASKTLIEKLTADLKLL